TYLSALGQAGGVVVTIRTVQPLSCRVLGVAERDSISRGIGRCSGVLLRRVADSARGEVAPVGLRARRVTGVTTVVRFQSRRNRQRNAAAQGRAVASDAAALRFGAAGQVLRVIELHIEVLSEVIGKRLTRRVGPVDILMTN